MKRRALLAVPLVALLLAVPGVQAANPPTTVHLSVVGFPKTATTGTPFKLTVKVTDRGPLAAHGLEIQVGVSKITGIGAHAGLILGPWMHEKAEIAQLNAGQSKTVVLHVLIPTKPAPGQVGTLGASFTGPGGYWIGPSLTVQSPAGTKWTGAGTKNADVTNITLAGP